MGFVFPGIEQSCSGLDSIIGRQLWREKIEPELERGEQSQGVLCKAVQSGKRIRILFLPRFTVPLDRLYMLFGPTIRFVPFLLRRFYSLHHLVHPDLEASLIPFLFGCRENIKWRFSWYRNENDGGERRRKRKGRSFPVRNNKGRGIVCTLQRYKCNAPFCILPYSLNHPPTTVQLLTHTTHQRYACAFFFFF